MAILYGACDFCGKVGKVLEVFLVDRNVKGLACVEGSCWTLYEDKELIKKKNNKVSNIVFEQCDACGKRGKMLEINDTDGEVYYLCKDDCLWPDEKEGVEVRQPLSQEWLESKDPVGDLFASDPLLNAVDPVSVICGE